MHADTWSCARTATCHWTFHRVGDSLKCHLCGYERTSSQSCEKCRSRQLHYTGVARNGSSWSSRRFFPERVFCAWTQTRRLGRKDTAVFSKSFSTGQYPILLGTQMVTKGHHFPNVNLVGVVSAEEGLNFPDFRSPSARFSNSRRYPAARAARERWAPW
jgi:primosomal protein N' (replication factor Y)